MKTSAIELKYCGICNNSAAVKKKPVCGLKFKSFSHVILHPFSDGDLLLRRLLQKTVFSFAVEMASSQTICCNFGLHLSNSRIKRKSPWKSLFFIRLSSGKYFSE